VERRTEAQDPVIVQEVDDAPVGKDGDGKARDPSQVGLAIRRRPENLLRLFEHALSPVAMKTLVPRHAGRAQCAETR
jgi:hypothetical protein